MSLRFGSLHRLTKRLGCANIPDYRMSAHKVHVSFWNRFIPTWRLKHVVRIERKTVYYDNIDNLRDLQVDEVEDLYDVLSRCLTSKCVVLYYLEGDYPTLVVAFHRANDAVNFKLSVPL